MSRENASALKPLILQLVPANGATISNQALIAEVKKAARQAGIKYREAWYWEAQAELVAEGKLAKGKGRGGSVRLVEAREPGEFALEQPVPSDEKAENKQGKKRKSGPRAKRGEDSDILSYRHIDKRKNNPPVGLVKPENDPETPKTRWAYDPHIDPTLQFDNGREQVEKLIDDALASGDEAVMREALSALKRMSEPYLNWTGKAERTSFEVDTVSLHVHERVDPATILAAVRKRMKDPKGRDTDAPKQTDWLTAPFENLPLRDAIDFYKHERGWSNRLIAGDSLLVMNSLLQKESMAGQVQMIYIDPPYGIKYGSNFQPFVNKRDVKDRKDEDLTQEPEMIKAFRDTWELGIHSYLAYLRDRLLVAKELLSESGSLFVQISDENLHHVREVMDDVFGAENFLSIVSFTKAAGGLQASNRIGTILDYIVWYAKDSTKVKYKPLYTEKVNPSADGYNLLSLPGGYYRTAKQQEKISGETVPDGVRYTMSVLLTKPGPGAKYDITSCGKTYNSGNRWWGTTAEGLNRALKSMRAVVSDGSIRLATYFDEFPYTSISNLWSGFGGAPNPVYVVQTNESIVQRCLLMTTDPGDLVMDPTCGSGTTAFVAEKWGRRWITCDTSRVAISLAKQRLMTASYDYYELKYPHEGLKSGFIYKTVPHVTLKSIANNPEIDEIYERMHPAIEKALGELNAALKGQKLTYKVAEGGRKGGEVDFAAPDSKTVELPSGDVVPVNALMEWEVPFEFPEGWPENAKSPFEAFHKARQAMQKRMDDSIAAHADQEVLYDQPQVSKDKLRITGPFTVEAVPFPSVLSLEEAEQPKEADVAIARSGESARQHQWRDELLKTGIRGPKLNGNGAQMLRFAELETLPGTRHLHCTGTLESGERVVVSFGPAHAALEQKQVELALTEAETLRPAPKFVVFAAFTFDPEAAKDIDHTNWPGVTLLKAQMNTDLLTEDLKKARASNQSFWLMGQPDVELRRLKDDRYQVEVHGFDYFDTAGGELVSGGKNKIAAWELDTDYDERSLLPRQVFFPMAGRKDGWYKLKKNIRAELDESLLGRLHGTVSLPFEAGENRKIAVKIVDDRGIESLKILALE